MKYVFIHSTRTVNVTTGLQFQNKTNPNLNVKDNFKIKPVWPTMIVQLLEGRHLYPSIVADFNSVKSLKEAGIVSIAEGTDEIPADENLSRIKDIEKKLRSLILAKQAEEDKKIEEAKQEETEIKKEKKTNKKKETEPKEEILTESEQ